MVKQSRTLSILLTRPQVQSERFANLLRQQVGGIAIVHSPLLVPHFLTCAIAPRDFSGVIFTSETAVQALARHPAHECLLQAKIAYCVGDRTAAAARAAGFDAQSARGGVDDLVGLIRGQNLVQPLLYLRGAETVGDLTNSLNSAGIETVEAVIYAQIANALSDAALRLLRDDQPLVIPVFSPRSADLLASECHHNTVHAPLYLAALSGNVAHILAGIGHAALETATRPDAAAMVTTVQRLCTLARNA